MQPTDTTRWTRRRVLQSAGAALTAAAVAQQVHANQTTKPAARPTLCLFSKALQNRPAGELPRMLTELGIEAVDLTVRPGGHVLPERAADDLPRAHEQLRAAGIAIPMITTAITDATEDHAETILATAAKLGIRFAKIGYYPYDDLHKIHATLANVRARLKDVAALCKRHGMAAGFHNHSGNNVGAAMWDVWELIRDQDPAAIGSYFDLGHATAEGAVYGWRIGLNLMISRIVIVGVKDVGFGKNDRGGWKTTWGPLGEGMVRFDEAFRRLKEHGFTGPISLHVEYGPYASPVGSEEDRRNLEYIRHDLAFARKALAKADLV